MLEIKIEDDPTEVSQEPKQSKKSKYQPLLKNSDVNRWYRNMMRGSPITADERLRRLGWLCERFQTTPEALAKLSKKTAGDFLLDVATDLEDGKLRSSYIANIIKAAKSWLKFNGKKPDVEIKFARETGKYAHEKPPTTDELRRILNAADMRQKVAISLMAFTGFRDQTLGNYKGVDGLKIADFPEITINDGRVDFRKIPTIVRCRSGVSKIGYEYESFLNEEGCEYLKAYLEDRMRPKTRKVKRDGKWIEEQVQRETLNLNSPIITPKQLDVGSHIRTTNIGDIIRKAIVKAGFQSRPYVCRRYFATRALRAEDDRLIPNQYTKFWMGHMGEILLRYTLGKGLDPDDLERMRNAYQRVDEAHLSTRGRKTIPQEKIVSTLRNEWLRMAGYADDEVSKLGDLSKLSQEEIQELVRKKNAERMGLSGKGRQKVVSMTELSQVIGEGWEFVSSLPNNQAIVRLPS